MKGSKFLARCLDDRRLSTQMNSHASCSSYNSYNICNSYNGDNSYNICNNQLQQLQQSGDGVPWSKPG